MMRFSATTAALVLQRNLLRSLQAPGRRMPRVRSRSTARVRSRVMARVRSRISARTHSRITARMHSRVMVRVRSRISARTHSRIIARMHSRIITRMRSRILIRIITSSITTIRTVRRAALMFVLNGMITQRSSARRRFPKESPGPCSVIFSVL